MSRVVGGMEWHDGSEAVDRLLGDLGRWAADLRAADAAEARSRQRWLRHQAEEGATFAGLVVDLAEREHPVVVRMNSGRSHQGRLVAVGRDFCVLSSARSGADGPVVASFLATDAVASVRAQPGETGRSAPQAAGGRPAPLATTMAYVLADLAGERPRVKLGVLGEPEPLVGELRSVGEDVATVRLAGEPPATVYVRLGSVSELSLLGSG